MYWRMKSFYFFPFSLVNSFTFNCFRSKFYSNFARAFAFINEDEETTWPDDASTKLFVGNWKYWYRENGMRTSTDDVLTSYLASKMVLQNNLKVTKYVDLGCGIGSILLLTAHKLSPTLTLGIEAQQVSVNLLQKTLDDLPKENLPRMQVSHKDLRNFFVNRASNLSDYEKSFIGSCDLITANPPYSPISGTFPKDPQRLAARFEVRGGVEEYLETSRVLLSSNGILFLVFWTKSNSDSRIRLAVTKNNLFIKTSTQVLMGKNLGDDETKLPTPKLIIYEIMKNDNISKSVDVEVRDILDIRVPLGESAGYNSLYRDILKYMNIHEPLHVS